jgi:protein arginine N-methyltransferase 1
VVADVGAGTGILTLLACRAGARRVFAIEPSGIIATAKESAQANGVADRVSFINAHAHEAVLPERCDLVVSDFIGHFAYDAGLFSIADDYARLLAPHGVSVPSALTLVLTPADSSLVRGALESWREPLLGFDMRAGLRPFVNTPLTDFTGTAELLSDDAVCATADLIGAPDVVRIRGDVRASRDGAIRALAGWFRARLAPGVEMTNDPRDPRRIARRNLLLPLAEPIAVSRGERVHLDVLVRPRDLVIDWRVEAQGRAIRQSSFQGLLLRGAVAPPLS